MFQASSLGSVSPRVAPALTWLLIAGMAWSVARSVLFFLGDSSTGTAAAPVIDTTAPGYPGNPAVDIQAVIQRHLFGTPTSTGPAVARVATVETRLPLELQAVFVATTHDQDSRAIIAEKGSTGRLYRLESQLPGGATLAEVHADHIVISRSGSRERLNFPRLTAGMASPLASEAVMEPYTDTPAEYPPEETVSDAAPDYDAPVPPDPVPSTPEPAPAETLQDYQARLEADPQGTLDALGVAAVDSGDAAGYRVGNLAQSPHLRQTGLQPGDVIVSVNGKPVGNVDSDRMELANVLSQGSARIEIQRGSRRFFVNTSLEQQ